jgi:uroporphyrinogen-III synthase
VTRPILIVRPEPGASATAERAAAIGLDAIVRPLFEIHAVAWTAPDAARFDAIFLTSANAVRFGGAQTANYRHLPVYAVGEATARAAMAAGFSNVSAGTTDAAAFVQVIAEAKCKRVLHLAGRDRTNMDDPPFSVETVTVYASEVRLPPTIAEDAVILLHSTRAALRLSAIAIAKSSIAIVAISSAVADAAGSGWQSVSVAAQPRDAAMLALAASLCETAHE